MKQIGMQDFAGKRVWVIGASSGIGEACAIALFAAGASVALSGRRLRQLTNGDDAVHRATDLGAVLIERVLLG